MSLFDGATQSIRVNSQMGKFILLHFFQKYTFILLPLKRCILGAVTKALKYSPVKVEKLEIVSLAYGY